MTEKKLTTSTLLSRLFRTQNLERFLSTYGNEMRSEPLCVYLDRLCEEKDAIPAKIIRKAGIDKAYGYQIFNGTKQNPSRDLMIQIAFGFELSYDETQELLKAAGKNTLSPRVGRDAVVIFALNKKYSVHETQNALDELKLPVLRGGIVSECQKTS